jgi:hypothetical protein
MSKKIQETAGPYQTMLRTAITVQAGFRFVPTLKTCGPEVALGLGCYVVYFYNTTFWRTSFHGFITPRGYLIYPVENRLPMAKSVYIGASRLS